MIKGIFRAGLRVTSKASALEFYRGVKGVLLLPISNDMKLRIEPNNHISTISARSIDDGTAVFIPAIKDDDGSIAYANRRYINQYLKSLND